METTLKRMKPTDEQKMRADTAGVLLSSGMIAGGALTAVVIAFVVLGYDLAAAPIPEGATYSPDAVIDPIIGGTKQVVPTFLDEARWAIGLKPNAWLGLIAFIGIGFLLIRSPLKAARR